MKRITKPSGWKLAMVVIAWSVAGVLLSRNEAPEWMFLLGMLLVSGASTWLGIQMGRALGQMESAANITETAQRVVREAMNGGKQ